MALAHINKQVTQAQNAQLLEMYEPLNYGSLKINGLYIIKPYHYESNLIKQNHYHQYKPTQHIKNSNTIK